MGGGEGCQGLAMKQRRQTGRNRHRHSSATRSSLTRCSPQWHQEKAHYSMQRRTCGQSAKKKNKKKKKKKRRRQTGWVLSSMHQEKAHFVSGSHERRPRLMRCPYSMLRRPEGLRRISK